MRRSRIDRLLVGAAVALLVVVAADALNGLGRGDRSATPRPSPPTPPSVYASAPPERIALRGSPETLFLPTCSPRGLSLTVVPGPALLLRYRGGPCQLRRLRLEAVVRDPSGKLLYRGPALRSDALAGNIGNGAERTAPLVPGLLHCDVQAPLAIEVRGAGLAARGVTRCRGTP
jgi:hypothetical protein